MTMITPSYLGETIEYSSLHACRSTLEDPTFVFLHLLERQTKGVSELFLAHAELQTTHPNAASNVLVNRFGDFLNCG